MLEQLGVDVIEAGFPISSPGDFQAVQQISKEVKNCAICALTRARTEDIDVAAAAVSKAVHPRIHTGLGVSDIHLEYKLRMSREEALESRCKSRPVCEEVRRGCAVLCRGRRPRRSRVSVQGARSGHCRRRYGGQHSGHHGLYHARGVGRIDRGYPQQRAQHRQSGHICALPQRSGHGHGQHPGGPAEWGAAGRGHDQWPWRARRQRLAGRSGHVDAYSPGCVRIDHRHRYQDDLPDQPARQRPDRVRGAAQQSHRGRETRLPTHRAFTRMAP